MKVEKGADRGRLLLFAVMAAAACAIVYELIIAAVSSYLLGNTVHQFSITIGLFMFSMGLGSFLSKYIERRILDRFILVEASLGLIGGVSSSLLFAAYVYFDSEAAYAAAMYALILIIGALVGLEIPLLTRLMRERASLQDALAKALAFDYIGALAGAVAFPYLLLKSLGLIQSGFVVGLFNAVIGGAVLAQRWKEAETRRFFSRLFGGFSRCARFFWRLKRTRSMRVWRRGCMRRASPLRYARRISGRLSRGRRELDLTQKKADRLPTLRRRSAATTSASSLTAKFSSAPLTNTATMRRSFIRR